ncbi:MAG: hypothetical protein JXC36_08485 [Candidatus Atribacteria bacterium]|nr:hypothetical protein [Candidatus Atribacteria bacterium]
MINISLHPDKVYYGQNTEIVLRLTNNGKGICTNIRLSFQFSREILIIGGKSRLLRIEYLENSKYFDYELNIKATQKGVFKLTTTNFSYIDSTGRSVRVSQLSIPIHAKQIPKKVEQPKRFSQITKGINMEDTFLVTWGTTVINKAVEYLFNQAGEVLKDWRKKRIKNEKDSLDKEAKDGTKSIVNNSDELKALLTEQFNKIERNSQIASFRMHLRESEALVRQIENLQGNKLRYEEKASTLLSPEDEMRIQSKIEEFDHQIAEKSNRLRTILEKLSFKKIYVPALDE